MRLVIIQWNICRGGRTPTNRARCGKVILPRAYLRILIRYTGTSERSGQPEKILGMVEIRDGTIYTFGQRRTSAFGELSVNLHRNLQTRSRRRWVTLRYIGTVIHTETTWAFTPMHASLALAPKVLRTGKIYWITRLQLYDPTGWGCMSPCSYFMATLWWHHATSLLNFDRYAWFIVTSMSYITHANNVIRFFLFTNHHGEKKYPLVWTWFTRLGLVWIDRIVTWRCFFHRNYILQTRFPESHPCCLLSFLRCKWPYYITPKVNLQCKFPSLELRTLVWNDRNSVMDKVW